MFKSIIGFFKKDEPKLSDHKQRIVSLLKSRWTTQIDCAQMGLTLNLSKRLCELEIELAPKWKIERRWKNGQRVKEYKISRA